MKCHAIKSRKMTNYKVSQCAFLSVTWRVKPLANHCAHSAGAGDKMSEDGVGYRLRFLRKSHVRWRRTDDALYACVFCVNSLRTTDPSDPTVFITSQALLRHIARHGRPLPKVANFIVVETPTVPPEHLNDYDLHLPGPLPARQTVLEREPQVAALPTGLATAVARPVLYERTPDKSHTLEVLVGSRVTGLEWPAKFGGEWCSGWYDGVHGSVPFKLVQLERPLECDLPKPVNSAVTARARFKFSHKDKRKTPWLKFGEKDTITNICCKFHAFALCVPSLVYSISESLTFFFTQSEQGHLESTGAGRAPTPRASGASSHRHL